MASLTRHKRRPKLVTPANSSFSNCVQDHLFIQSLRGPLDNFKPIVYLDEHGRKHGRVSDHLLQREIETDREKLKKQLKPKVPISSTLYGIRNPNIVALVKDVSLDNKNDDDDDFENELAANDEIKMIEYKKPSNIKSPEMKKRQASSTSGKQSVRFNSTPSVNMSRLIDGHITGLNDDDDSIDGDVDDEEDLESSKPVSKPDIDSREHTGRSELSSSDMTSTPQDNHENRSNNLSRESQRIHKPPAVEDLNDTHEQRKPIHELSASDNTHRQSKSPNSSENKDERIKSSSSRPKTGRSSRSRTNTEEAISSRAASSASSSSVNTSALLRSDDNDSQHLSDEESNNQEEKQIHIETPVKSEHSTSPANDVINIIEEEHLSPLPIHTIEVKPTKGEYDSSRVMQLKESFQPIITEAASYGHLDVVRQLIKNGQSVHTQNILERTALHEACASGNDQLVSELLNKGALIDQKDSQGLTSFHVAASHGSTKCVEILSKRGCDINVQDSFGRTAAHYSAMHDHVDTLEYLINVNHINLSITTKQSKFPIHYAAKNGAKNVLNYFIQSNLMIYITDINGNTIAHEACEYNQLDCIKLIWKKKRSLLKYKNNLGRTPMHMAALFGSADVLHWLLELKIIDIDQPDNDGYTMAHLAASRGQGECFFCLVMHGAQLDLYTFDRQESVIDVARRSGKGGRIEQARSGTLHCPSCDRKAVKDKYDQAHARNAVEQLIHTQIQHGYNLSIPTNRSSITTKFVNVEPSPSYSSNKRPSSTVFQEQVRVVLGCGANIISSIGIIFLNKYIFTHCQIKTMTLTAIQMAFTSLGLLICLRMNTFTRKTVPIIKVLPLAIAFCAFVVFTNLSLEYNTVGTYQLFKVLTTPVVALISWQYYKTKYSRMVIATLIPVVLGVCTHSVNDIKLTFFGTVIASIGVLAASLYQVWVGECSKELDMNPQQLLFYQAPLSAVLLVPLILYMESLPSYKTSKEQQTAFMAVVASGIVAFAVNLSVYWVIKNTSVLTYNMIGHMKTVSILVGGFMLFQDNLNFKQFLGILLTLFGLFAYTFVKMGEQNQLPCKRWNVNPTGSIV
ncbi:unnamed protein product [Adineta steineri]|uniref:Sugar phosphate transporter domain-containing protein n=1 Tax=Adineta steineri TaxID=433720 RepID=A0A814MI47_9BILA|nr:unnamed protein product [Adineta steineri]